MATGRRHDGYGTRPQRLGRLLYECRRAEGTETEDGPQWHHQQAYRHRLCRIVGRLQNHRPPSRRLSARLVLECDKLRDWRSEPGGELQRGGRLLQPRTPRAAELVQQDGPHAQRCLPRRAHRWLREQPPWRPAVWRGGHGVLPLREQLQSGGPLQGGGLQRSVLRAER